STVLQQNEPFLHTQGGNYGSHLHNRIKSAGIVLFAWSQHVRNEYIFCNAILNSMNTKDWGNKTISPTCDKPQKVHIQYPCPGLCRFSGMVSFLVVGLGLYYGGTALLGLERLDWAAPVWTAKHVVLVAASILLGALAGLIGFAYTMTIEVRNERLNDLFIVLWQFLANGSMLWIVVIGISMSVLLGREEAKAAVLHFGAERATIYVVGTGSIVGLLLGAAFFLAPIIRFPFIGYLAFSASVSLLAARWHFNIYGIEGKSWIVAGVVFPIILLIFTLSMIERDRRQRRLVMEQSS
ncbi:MAG: hypothetical protein WC654_08425, partial [Patescibacteria group bacterium]